MALSLTVNETLKWLSSLPTQCRSHCGGDSVAIGIVSLCPWDVGPSQELCGDSSALNQFNQPSVVVVVVFNRNKIEGV